MKIWLRQHRFALGQALRHLFKPRSGFFLNMLVVAIALSLPFAGITLLENIKPVSDQLAVEPEISIFLSTDMSADKASGLTSSIRRLVQENRSVATINFISKEKALNSLKDSSGMADAISALGSNPLPDAYLLKLSGITTSGDANRLDALAAQLKILPGVEHVQIDSAWIKRLTALLQVLQTALLLLATTLGIVVVAVVFNTIRMQVMSQREEIELSRLVGATDAFIYRPFYYSGALLGLSAGAFALGTVAASLYPLNNTISGFTQLYGSEFYLVPLNAAFSALLLTLSAGLGFLGAVLSVNRHLKRLTKLT